MVCEDVPETVIVPTPLFLITYNLPEFPTEVGKVTVNVPLQST